MATDSPPATTLSVDCIIVGAGFSGCYSLHMLRKQGYTAKIIDAGSDFGGVWHFNHYPGARVDSEMPLYQLTEPATIRQDLFSSFSSLSAADDNDNNDDDRYPSADSMRAYFRHVSELLDLRRDAVFGHRVVEAHYDARAHSWRLISDQGLRVQARYAVFATGTTNDEFIPRFPGMDRFAGRILHARHWPRDLFCGGGDGDGGGGVGGGGKRIAVIGQGCTGAQIARELARLDDRSHLTVFVRTPAIALPLGDRTTSVAVTKLLARIGYADVLKTAKTAGLVAVKPEMMMMMMTKPSCHPAAAARPSYYQASPAERRALWERLWEVGGGSIVMDNYRELAMDKEVNAAFYEFWKEKTAARVSNPAKRAILVPEKQPMWFMAKRPVMETDYFEMMDRDNVEIVDLHKDRIKAFVEDGIVTVRGEETAATAAAEGDKEEEKEEEEKEAETLHKFDVIVLATGYDSMTGSLYGMNIRDKNGVLLQEKWRDGVTTHLGMMVPGMPNAFLLYGPQTPGPLTTGPLFIELQVEFMCALMARWRDEWRGRRRNEEEEEEEEEEKEEKEKAIEVTREAAAAWVDKLQAVFWASLASEGDSWWVGSNVLGKRREPLIFFGSVPDWIAASEKTLRSWDDFVGGGGGGGGGCQDLKGRGVLG